jgi:hypothetical protein
MTKFADSEQPLQLRDLIPPRAMGRVYKAEQARRNDASKEAKEQRYS